MVMAKKTFESALSRLEQITEELEDGDLSLDNSLKKFDEDLYVKMLGSEQQLIKNYRFIKS